MIGTRVPASAQSRAGREMIMKRILYWSPRVLGFLFAAFTAIFAMDVLQDRRGLWGTLLALFVHLIPTVLLLALLVAAWRWEWVGAVLFSALGVLYVMFFWERFPWQTHAAMAGPLLCTGLLFLIDWLYRRSNTVRT